MILSLLVTGGVDLLLPPKKTKQYITTLYVYDANDGYPSYFLINENHGKSFRDATESSGLLNKRFRRTYSASFVDLDEDGHLDLLKVNDFAGFDLFYNNGKGVFRNVTQEKVNKSSLFGMAHSFGDFNKDGFPDLYICSDYAQPDLLFMNNGNKTFTNKTEPNLKHITYFSMGNEVTDVNND